MGSVFPFDPFQTVGLTRIVGPTDFTPAAPGWSQFLTRNPARLWFSLSSFTSATIASVWPNPLPADGGIKELTGASFVTVTNFEYPGLVQGDWWLWDGGTNPWQIFECWVITPGATQ